MRPRTAFPSLGLRLTVALSVVTGMDLASAQTTGSSPAQSPAATMRTEPFIELGPMVGHTDSRSTRIWVKTSGAAQFSILLGKREDLSDGRRVEGPGLETGNGFMGYVEAANLESSQRYFYCPLLDGHRALPRPYPSLTTAPPEGQPGRVRFAFISCLGYHGYDAAAAWGDMTRTNIDLILMLGDNHYANSSNPEAQRAAYFDHRQVAGCRALTSRIPTYAIWDDHDYGPDNSDGTLPGKEKSLQTFREHWANPAWGEPDNPGIYYKFTRGTVDFFMLDDRYYRTPNKDTQNPARTLLGPRQLAWLKRELLASRAVIKVIAAGSEWQSHSTEDCWSNFKTERDHILQFIQENQVRGVLLLSGDRHFTAAYQVLGKFIEITSGPFGSTNARSKPLPEMFLYFDQGKLYAILDIDTTGPDPAVTLEVYRAGNGRLARRPFTWPEILGTAEIPPLSSAPQQGGKAK